MWHLNNYKTITCACGTKLKIPPNAKVLTSNAHTVAVSIESESKGDRKKDEAKQTTCVTLATLVQLSNRHFRYLNSLRACKSQESPAADVGE